MPQQQQRAPTLSSPPPPTESSASPALTDAATLEAEFLAATRRVEEAALRVDELRKKRLITPGYSATKDDAPAVAAAAASELSMVPLHEVIVTLLPHNVRELELRRFVAALGVPV